MKVLHLEFGRNLYGGTLQVAYLMRGLASSPAVESHLACPLGSELMHFLARDDSIISHPLRIRGDFDVSIYFQLRKIVQRVQPDLLHVHSRRGADLWGVLVARNHNLPYILTRRVDNPEARWLARWRTRKAAYVVGISRKICEVMESCGVEKGKIRRILSRVDLEAYRPGGDMDYFRKVMGLEPGQTAVAIIAQLIERKGHLVLFEAIPDILKAHSETRFLVFGKGRMEQTLKDKLADKPWKDSVRFMGFRDDLDRLIPCMDVIAHPAYMEGLGVSLLQAAACGIPIVGSRAGGIPEIVRHGENGFLIEPGDSHALAGHLSQLLGDIGLRRKMGERGRKIAEEDFSISGMVAAYADLYSEALKAARV